MLVLKFVQYNAYIFILKFYEIGFSIFLIATTTTTTTTTIPPATTTTNTTSATDTSIVLQLSFVHCLLNVRS